MRFITFRIIGSLAVSLVFAFLAYPAVDSVPDVASGAFSSSFGGTGASTSRIADVSAVTPREPTERVEVVRVIDGDTFDVADGRRIRVYGIDTRERGEACYWEASNRLRELVGKAVLVEPGPRELDPHGRTLRYVYTLDGVSIDAVMVAEGLAPPWMRDGQHRDMLGTLAGAADSRGDGCIYLD